MLPTFDPLGVGLPPTAAICRRCEDLGFDALWAGDHLSFNSPILESTQVLATAAAMTVRPTIGFGVLLLALRNPAWAAKQIGSLQLLSGGRVVLGVGVGGENPAEWVAAGVDPSKRGKITDAVLEALPGLLAGEAREVLGVPVPALLPASSMPPVWVGGRSDAALQRAVQFGSHWLSVFADARKVAEIRDRLQELAEAAHKPPPALAATVFVHVTSDVAAGSTEAGTYLMRQYGVPWERMSRYCLVGDEHVVAAGLEELVRIGVHDFVLMPAAADVDAQLERLAEVRSMVVAGEASSTPA